MGEIKISIPSENIGFPYPVCGKTRSASEPFRRRHYICSSYGGHKMVSNGAADRVVQMCRLIGDFVCSHMTLDSRQTVQMCGQVCALVFTDMWGRCWSDCATCRLICTFPDGM